MTLTTETTKKFSRIIRVSKLKLWSFNITTKLTSKILKTKITLNRTSVFWYKWYEYKCDIWISSARFHGCLFYRTCHSMKSNDLNKWLTSTRSVTNEFWRSSDEITVEIWFQYVHPCCWISVRLLLRFIAVCRWDVKSFAENLIIKFSYEFCFLGDCL